MSTTRFGFALRQLRDAAAWRPAHAHLLLDQIVGRNRNHRAGYGDVDHLNAAVAWLERAQDATGNGGIAGRYRLRSGWTSAYPETTGYIIPTFLALAAKTGDQRFRERARMAVEFLLPLQLDTGAFPGGEIARNRSEPSFFNTGQILAGLIAWHREMGDDRAIQAARKAADWLLTLQDGDGAFRRHLYQGIVSTYGAHASCWVAELGVYSGEPRYLESARLHVEWVLSQRDSDSGWFDLCGFTSEDHRARRSVLHTIAYTLWGVLASASLAEHAGGIAAVEQAALAIARRMELSQSLPGVMDHRWRPAAEFSCLTGNAQMALVWFALFNRTRDTRFLNAALKAIDLVKRAQPMDSSDPGVRGGVPGSDPVWGEYIRMALPNWAAKFFIDALLEKEATLGSIRSRQLGSAIRVADVPQTLPDIPQAESARPLRIVVLATPSSRKAVEMVRTWSWFRPAAVVMLSRPPAKLWDRLLQRLAEEGPGFAFGRRVAGPAPAARRSEGTGSANVEACCRQAGIPTLHVDSLESPEALAAIGALEPDLFVFAGGAILREPLLEIPRLGTINAHMGRLPFYRGMNVAEWACFHGDAVGCSTHLIDAGIDTGDILCVRTVPAGDVRSVRALRERVGDAQMVLLGEVLRYVVSTGQLPPRRRQWPGEGRQFFRMHHDLLRLLDRELAAGRSAHQPEDETVGESVNV